MRSLYFGCMKNPVFNVGTGIETSINALYRMIAKEVGYTQEPQHGLARKGDLIKSCLDITKMKEVLSWEPQIGLEDGLKRIISAKRG